MKSSSLAAGQRRSYIHGSPYAFALALHEFTNWPIALFDTPEHSAFHAALRHPDGGYVDASGRFDEGVIKARFNAYGPHSVREGSAEDLRAIGEIGAASIKRAKDQIRRYAAGGDDFFCRIVTEYDDRARSVGLTQSF